MRCILATIVIAALAGAWPAIGQDLSARLGARPIPTQVTAARRDLELDALVAAYPQFLAGHSGDTLIWRDGTRMPAANGRTSATPLQLTEAPSIEEMFAWPYPLANQAIAPPTGDPGRLRPAALFVKTYGDCRRGQVAPNLERVTWVDGTTLLFTRVNGAADALRAVVADLNALGPGYAKYLSPSAGTYNCRVIAGTDLLSMHSYGGAVDLNTRYSVYWQWSDKAAHGIAPYQDQIPIQIVQTFERHGFIWGGRWADFDTMHFEYRPEIIAVARALAGSRQ
jgi:hypothetical protein